MGVKGKSAEKQISNDIIRNKLNGTKQSTVDIIPEKKFTAKDLLKYSGTWAGGREDAEKVLKYILENRTEAEF
jgi:hypothetical protein